MQPPLTRTPAKAEGPAPAGSPLNPGVGPVRTSCTCTQLLLCTVLLTSCRAECDKACFCLHCNPHQSSLVGCPASQDARQSQTKNQVPGEPVKLDTNVRPLGLAAAVAWSEVSVAAKLGVCRIRCQVKAWWYGCDNRSLFETSACQLTQNNCACCRRWMWGGTCCSRLRPSKPSTSTSAPGTFMPVSVGACRHVLGTCMAVTMAATSKSQ